MRKQRHRAVWFAGFALFSSWTVTANHALAATDVYLDNNGTAAGSGVTTGFPFWENNVWSTDSTGSSTTSAFVDGEIPHFAAGTDAGSSNYQLFANANHVIAGMRLDASGGGTVNVTGSGVLTLASGLQDFVVNPTAGPTLEINNVLAGGGIRLANHGGVARSNVDLFGNNTYSGGTSIEDSYLVNFKMNSAFGTGPISLNTSQTVTLNNAASSTPLTLSNAVNIQAGTTNLGVNASSAASTINFTNTWTLSPGTLSILVTSPAKMTISGAITGSGAGLKVNSSGGSSGTLVLSGANSYTGTTVVGGRLVLGAANAITSSSNIEMAGGNAGILDPDGFNQSMPSTLLDVDFLSGAIDFAAGGSEMDFANSSGETWAGNLNLLNYNFSVDKLRFGADATGLSSDELSKILVGGQRPAGLSMDSNGFLVIQAPEPSAAMLLAAAPLVLLRRRRPA